MSTYTPSQIAEVLRKHAAWVHGDADGTRANLTEADLTEADLTGASLTGVNLYGANLYGVDLTGVNLSDANLTRAELTRANLTRANLTRANLTRANLSGVNLTGADLTGASLSGASLSDADLSGIRDDIRTILDTAPNEVAGLLLALREGRVDGSTYYGECACLVGTIANVRHCNVNSIGIELDGNRPAERWFLAIRKGHRPDWCPIARITERWIVEWMVEHRQELPLSIEQRLDVALKRIAELEAEKSGALHHEKHPHP